MVIKTSKDRKNPKTITYKKVPVMLTADFLPKQLKL
jgi:hypothetical protein